MLIKRQVSTKQMNKQDKNRSTDIAQWSENCPQIERNYRKNDSRQDQRSLKNDAWQVGISTKKDICRKRIARELMNVKFGLAWIFLHITNTLHQ